MYTYRSIGTHKNSPGNLRQTAHKSHPRRLNRFACSIPDLLQALRLVIFLALLAHPVVSTAGQNPGTTAPPEVETLYELVQAGEGEAALEQVVALAAAVGGWIPAPGDEVVFDPDMARWIRARLRYFDDPPPHCAQMYEDETECLARGRLIERQVRIGYSLFSTRTQDGSEVIRPTLDDVLATYVEEVAHSWQEYMYETEGRGSGERTRPTTFEEAERWTPGREYQAKTYVLGLDGVLLELSVEERAMLQAQICVGYANPTGYPVPSYGPPAGWPIPEAWPTSAPSAAELSDFCAGVDL